MTKYTHVDSSIPPNDKNVRTLAEASVATDWYVEAKVHNQTLWDAPFYQRMMAAAGNIEKEPQSVSAGSTGSGGKYDAPSGPYGVSTLICYDSPDSNWRFAWCFVMPYVGSNSCEARIVDNDTSINQSLFDSMDGSDVTATSQSDMIVDGTKYTFTISCSIGGGTTPTADFYINYVAA